MDKQNVCLDLPAAGENLINPARGCHALSGSSELVFLWFRSQIYCDQLCREWKVAARSYTVSEHREKLHHVLTLLDCQPVSWDSVGQCGLSSRKGVAGDRLSSPSQLWPEEVRDKKQEKISRERMWLLVQLMAESCELGMGKKAAGFSRKDSVTVEDGLLLIICSELFLQEQWISVLQSFPICFQNSSENSSFLPFLSPSALSTVIFIFILPLCSPKFLWGWSLNEAIDKVTHINQQKQELIYFYCTHLFSSHPKHLHKGNDLTFRVRGICQGVLGLCCKVLWNVNRERKGRNPSPVWCSFCEVLQVILFAVGRVPAFTPLANIKSSLCIYIQI